MLSIPWNEAFSVSDFCIPLVLLCVLAFLLCATLVFIVNSQKLAQKQQLYLSLKRVLFNLTSEADSRIDLQYTQRQLKALHGENLKRAIELRAILKNIVNSQYVLVDNHRYGCALQTPLRHTLKHIRTIADELALSCAGTECNSVEFTFATHSENTLFRRVNSSTHLYQKEIGQTHSFKIINIMKRVLSAHRLLLKERNITLTSNFSEVPVYARIEGEWLHRALCELVVNAVKTNKPGTSLYIGASVDNNSIKITVSDNGKGLPSEVIQAVNICQETSNERTLSHYEDVHPSLFSIQMNALCAGGKLDIKSAKDYLTEVSIYLPFKSLIVDYVPAKAHMNMARSKVADIGHIQLETIVTSKDQHQVDMPKEYYFENAYADNKILLIENNASGLQHGLQVLKSKYQVIRVKSLSKAIPLIHQLRPNAILIDSDADFSRGLSLQAYLNSSDHLTHIPLVLLGQNQPNVTQIHALKAGITAVLEKPITPEALSLVLEQVLLEKQKMVQRIEEAIASYHANTTSINAPVVCKTEKFKAAFQDVLQQYYQDERLTRERVAAIMSMSEKTLARRISASYELKFSELLKLFRLEKGKALILQGEQITFAAYSVGFSTPSYFTQCFRAQYGFSPSCLAKKLQEEKAALVMSA